MNEVMKTVAALCLTDAASLRKMTDFLLEDDNNVVIEWPLQGIQSNFLPFWREISITILASEHHVWY